MPLTRDFKETVKARALRDPAFRDALLTEAVESFLAGELGVGKVVLRDYIHATIGFERLAAETGSSSKSLMRMLSDTGKPDGQQPVRDPRYRPEGRRPAPRRDGGANERSILIAATSASAPTRLRHPSSSA